MNRLFSLIVIALLAGPNLGYADCLNSYSKAVDDLKKEVELHEGDWMQDSPITSRSRSEGFKMFVLWDLITSLGIPNVIGTSQYSVANAAYREALGVYSILKEAELGGGVHLIDFVEEIRSEKKLSGIDVDIVASAIRDANTKNYFCATGLVNREETKRIVKNLVSP